MMLLKWKTGSKGGQKTRCVGGFIMIEEGEEFQSNVTVSLLNIEFNVCQLKGDSGAKRETKIESDKANES